MATASTQLERRLVDTNAAAKFLGISGRTLWEITDRGEIPAVRVGPKLVRYDVRDLEAYIDASKRRAETPEQRRAREIMELRILNDLALIEERERTADAKAGQ
jgi:excisionase family DNA binding protein